MGAGASANQREYRQPAFQPIMQVGEQPSHHLHFFNTERSTTFVGDAPPVQGSAAVGAQKSPPMQLQPSGYFVHANEPQSVLYARKPNETKRVYFVARPVHPPV
jgi:hypothetical protein